MKDYKKKLTILCAIILVVIGGFYGTVYVLCKIYLSPASIKQTIITQAQKKFNRVVTVGSDIEFSIDWDMSPHLILHNVVVANSPWASNPNILTADEIEFHFDLANILMKRITVHAVKLINPAIYLEINDKQSNWDDLQKDLNSTPPSDLRLTVNKVQVENGMLTYNADKVAINKLDLTSSSDNSDFHLHVQGVHDNLPIKASLEVQTLITYFKLNIVNLQIGNSDISGNLTIEKQPVRIKGQFSSDKLLLKDFQTKSSNPSGEYSIPSTAIPVAQLRGSEFDISAQIGMIDLAGLTFKNVNINAKNVNNVLTINLDPPATVDAGKLSLNIKYDLNPQVPTLNLQAKTTTLQLGTILEQVSGKAVITGSSLDFSSSLQSQGSDLSSLVNNLSGKILLVAGPGEFQNSTAKLTNVFANVLSSVMTFDKQANSTAFKCGVMNFKVSGGVANANQGIGIEAANVNVLGNGMVDLRNGRIAFSIVPQTTISTNPADLTHFSVAQLVEVKGTISKPVVALNPVNLINQGAKAAISAGIAAGIASTGVGGALVGAELLQGKMGIPKIPGVPTSGNNNPPVSPCKKAQEAN